MVNAGSEVWLPGLCNKEHLAYLNGHTPVTDADWQLFDRQLFKFEVVELEHLKSEEEQALARLQQLLSEEDKDALWREWDAALRNAPLRPHPDGPTNGIPAKLMHPVAGRGGPDGERRHRGCGDGCLLQGSRAGRPPGRLERLPAGRMRCITWQAIAISENCGVCGLEHVEFSCRVVKKPNRSVDWSRRSTVLIRPVGDFTKSNRHQIVLHLAASGFVDLSRIGSHQTCITSMFEPGAVTKYVPIGPLGPFFRVSPNQHITNRAYQYGMYRYNCREVRCSAANEMRVGHFPPRRSRLECGPIGGFDAD
ncbi:hemerythrin domain-containing protein [Haematococcus lacustris]|uniref:Hemerythrin domain-containing protein n=1 Tax=Haematococcus lacustris TaxID=44745 RepID=A0A699Z6R7_HAELA|nr:hemerythrin domain-containing protein [Haematococcus lacustris]